MAVIVAVGVNRDSRREVLGLWVKKVTQALVRSFYL